MAFVKDPIPLSISKISQLKTTTIYKRDYWDKCKCDSLPEPVALIVLDTAVNMGVSAAILLLQEASGVQTDGIIGEKTINAVSGLDPAKIASDFMALRTIRHSKLSGCGRYGFGWFRRCFDVFH